MRKLIVVLVLAMAGCGGTTKSGNGGGGGSAGGGSAGGGAAPADMTMVDLLGPQSTCGHPGDTGNNVGVGKYCMTLGDCPSTAPLCTAIENSLEPASAQSYFCTVTCNSGDNSKCGDNASCICQSANTCACVPTSCGTAAPIVDMAK